MPYDLPRIPLPTTASSAELAALPASIREQALFSARLNLAHPVAEIGNKLKGILDGKLSDSEARRDIRAALSAAGYQPPQGEEGGLLDHTSKRRLDLILGQNVRSARNYAYRAAGMDPDVLDLWPAWELVRVANRREPRGDWPQRFETAGGKLRAGRMVALKTSPVWASLSRFNTPYPPFDFGSGMGVRAIPREDAVALGLIDGTARQTPEPIPYPAATEANLPDTSGLPALQAAIRKVFGGAARFDDAGALHFPTVPPASGSQGTATTLGLAPLDARTIATAPDRIPPREARALIDSGQATLTDHAGQGIIFDPAQQIPAARLTYLRQAFNAIREPQEVWIRNGRTYYFKTFRDAAGGTRRMLVIAKDGKVLHMIPSKDGNPLPLPRAGTLAHTDGEA